MQIKRHWFLVETMPFEYFFSGVRVSASRAARLPTDPTLADKALRMSRLQKPRAFQRGARGFSISLRLKELAARQKDVRKEREMQTIGTEPNTDNACRQRGARRVSKSLKPEHLHFTARLAPASQREKNKCVPIWYLF